MREQTRMYKMEYQTTVRALYNNRWYGRPEAREQSAKHYAKVWEDREKHAETQAQSKIAMKALILIEKVYDEIAGAYEDEKMRAMV